MKIQQNPVDCVVIGAGILGLWAARHAIKRGERVLVLEKRQGGGGSIRWVSWRIDASHARQRGTPKSKCSLKDLYLLKMQSRSWNQTPELIAGFAVAGD